MVGPEDFEAKPGSSMVKKKNCDDNPNGHDKKRKRTGYTFRLLLSFQQWTFIDLVQWFICDICQIF